MTAIVVTLLLSHVLAAIAGGIVHYRFGATLKHDALTGEQIIAEKVKQLRAVGAIDEEKAKGLIKGPVK